jgi:hypothetical protein
MDNLIFSRFWCLFPAHRKYPANFSYIQTALAFGVDIDKDDVRRIHGWQKHCRGLYQTPIAA